MSAESLQEAQQRMAARTAKQGMAAEVQQVLNALRPAVIDSLERIQDLPDWRQHFAAGSVLAALCELSAAVLREQFSSEQRRMAQARQFKAALDERLHEETLVAAQ